MNTISFDHVCFIALEERHLDRAAAFLAGEQQRLQLDRGARLFDGFVEPPRFAVRVAQVEVRSGQLRIERNRPLVAGDRVVSPAEAAKA